MQKNGLIRNIRLISKLWSQNLVKKQLQYEVKSNQTIKFGQFSFKNHAENEAGRLVPDFLLVFKNALYKVRRASGLQLSANIFW